MAGPKSAKGSILTVTIEERDVLYSSYMPFIHGGGLFVPTKKSYEIGDEVFLRLTLMDEANVLPVAGRVVWITPFGAQDNRETGIGIQFTDRDGSVRTKIEAHLGGMMQSDRPTSTM